MSKENNMKDYPLVEIDFNPKFEALKKINDKTTINVRYCLIKPFAFAHIYSPFTNIRDLYFLIKIFY